MIYLLISERINIRWMWRGENVSIENRQKFDTLSRIFLRQLKKNEDFQRRILLAAHFLISCTCFDAASKSVLLMCCKLTAPLKIRLSLSCMFICAGRCLRVH